MLTATTTGAPLVTDSVTMLGADARGRAAIAASHGGIYAAYLAAKAGLKAVILSDAGVGRERAGVGGLAYLATMGVPAAAIGHRSARIGDGIDCAKRGIITCVNEPAAAAGSLTYVIMPRLAQSTPSPMRAERWPIAAAGTPMVAR